MELAEQAAAVEFDKKVQRSAKFLLARLREQPLVITPVAIDPIQTADDYSEGEFTERLNVEWQYRVDKFRGFPNAPKSPPAPTPLKIVGMPVPSKSPSVSRSPAGTAASVAPAPPRPAPVGHCFARGGHFVAIAPAPAGARPGRRRHRRTVREFCLLNGRDLSEVDAIESERASHYAMSMAGGFGA